MSARRAAAELLVAVMGRGQGLDDALATTASFVALTGRDRAFARALATAGLRHLGTIDFVLLKFLERPLPEDALHARALLHLGATQMLVLGTPAHAAVGETVETANSMREARGFAKLMNAVLRRVAREGAALFAASPPGANLPAWLYTRWRAAYGGEAEAIAHALLAEPPLDLSVKNDAAGWAQKLGGALTPTGSVRLSLSPRGEGTGGGMTRAGEGIVEPLETPLSEHRNRQARLTPSHAPLPSRGEGVESLPGFAEGAWWVQDAAAALPARLLGDVRGRRVLDLCAAPGGKTLQMAAAGAQVTAVDKSESRLRRLRENLARTKLDAEIICADALHFKSREKFDAVLLDAPCTSTGTLRRHPEIAWQRRPTDIRALAELQARLVSACATLLKPGAPLVYAVCSLEPEEGPGIVAAALKQGWRRAPVQEIAGAGGFITAEGDLRTLPSHWPEISGLDGFFAARLIAE